MISAKKIFVVIIFALMLTLFNTASSAANEYTNPYESYANQNSDVQPIMDSAGNPINGTINVVNGVVQPITGAAGNVIGGTFGAVNGVVQPITDSAGNLVNGTMNVVNGVVQPITDTAGNVIGGAMTMVNGVLTPITDAVGNVMGGVNNLIGGILGGFGGNNVTLTGTGKTFANMKSIDEICKFSIDQKEGLNIISKSVSCFEGMFMGVVVEKVSGMTDFMREAVFAAMVLYVIFYGIKTSSGMVTEQRAKGEFFVHAIKIAFVSWMIMNYGILELWYLTLDIYNGLLDLVMIPAQMETCKVASKSVSDLWLSMDCILTEFIGWNATNGYGTTYNKVPLLFGMFTSAINSGSGGAFIAVLVFMSILTLVMSLMRVAFIYILSMMGLILLFMMAPVIIPMMLFPQTKPMFDGWWKTIISMVMQPVIIFAYLSFMMSIYIEIIDGPDGLKEVYANAKPQGQVSNVTNRGTSTGITSVFTMFDTNPKPGGIRMEPQLVFNLLSIFVISYLLKSFTDFVGSMGKELAGSPLSPDLSRITKDSTGGYI